VIGTGGKVIREIVATTGAKGRHQRTKAWSKVSASTGPRSRAAGRTGSVDHVEPEVGAIYDGKVVRWLISGLRELLRRQGRPGSRQPDLQRAVAAGGRPDRRPDGQGQADGLPTIAARPKLSMKVVDQENREDLTKKETAEAAAE